MLNKYARAFFTRVLTPFAALLLRLGVSPDAVTLIGTAGVMAGALVFFPMGEFFWGTIVITIFVFSDLVDGNMARQAGISSRWGAFLDSTLDRVADAAIFSGLILHFIATGDALLAGVTLFALVAGMLVSYAKARAEGLGLTCDVGLAERPERLVVVLVAACLSGLGVPYVLAAGMWLLAAAGAVTVVQRVVHVHRQTRER